MVKREGLEKAKDEFIPCLIYRQVWDSDRRWNTAGELKKVRPTKNKEMRDKKTSLFHYFPVEL